MAAPDEINASPATPITAVINLESLFMFSPCLQV